MQYTIKGARLEGESFSSSIGDNKSVDLTFTAQVGGPEDQENGIFMRGSYARWTSIPYWNLGAQKSQKGGLANEVLVPGA